MKIAFFSNYFNHHQKPLADAFNALDGVQYTFVATTSIPEFRKKLGYQEMKEDYVLDVTYSKINKQKALQLALDADVAIFLTTGMNEYIIPRLNTGKLSFEYSERWLKKGFINLLSPNLWKHQIMYYRYGRKANIHMLCCSAYAANDYYLLNSYKDRCYKWGYFTTVPKDLHYSKEITDKNLIHSKALPTIRLMWCARFIGWKHPELSVKLANRLKSDGYDFEINMFGNGELIGLIQEMIKTANLEECVHLMGNKKNEDILAAMQEHNIFLFTSDQNEGWGAVANEAMSNGCVIVGSDSIGCVPFLVNDGVNGMIFKSCSIDSLYEKVKYLLDNPVKRKEMAAAGYNTMRDIWSPKTAATRFLQLVDAFNNNQETPFVEGPCSKVEPIN